MQRAIWSRGGAGGAGRAETSWRSEFAKPARIRRGARSRRGLALAALALATSVALAACGGTPSGGGKATPTPASTPKSAARLTIETATVAGLGTILVDSHGRALYLLTSESGGKLTCTVASGCTSHWLEVDLPSGVHAARAGGGAKSSLLGTEVGAAGTVVTYKGWPLYTYAGDAKAGQAKGEGLKSYGGTWYALTAAGAPVTSSTSPTPSSGGYGY
ncbi:MAG: COG4315 family predicted lipoprotein [Candidatus Dormibacteria bacterium]